MRKQLRAALSGHSNSRTFDHPGKSACHSVHLAIIPTYGSLSTATVGWNPTSIGALHVSYIERMYANSRSTSTWKQSRSGGGEGLKAVKTDVCAASCVSTWPYSATQDPSENALYIPALHNPAIPALPRLTLYSSCANTRLNRRPTLFPEPSHTARQQQQHPRRRQQYPVQQQLR